MKKNSSAKQQNSLVGQLRKRLLLSVGLLVFLLLFLFGQGLYAADTQSKLSQQIISVHNAMNGMLSSMDDQASSLRGYVISNSPAALVPFNSGRPQFLAYLQTMKDKVNNSNFSAATTAALAQVERQANDWYNNYALIQVKNMQSGKINAARLASGGTTSKTLLDRFRAAMALLLQKVDQDLTKAQVRIDNIVRFTLFVTLLVSLIVIIILWRAFTLLAHALRSYLKILLDATDQLGSGDLSVRVKNLHYHELNQVGQAVNIMAESLRDQQLALKERDILESVLQLNMVLSNSLDLKALIDEFLGKLLTMLDLNLGGLYLYNSRSKQLTLFASLGSEHERIEKEFLLGDGSVGRAALGREPLYLRQPAEKEVGGLVLKSILGAVLPVSMYYLPLIRGNELLGVLAVGSAFPMNEKNRNVLNVMVSTLASTISNTMAYQRIQEQTKEQEQTNSELRQQRDELTSLNVALEEANRARSQFISTMSHELRTPLTSIIGFSQLMLREPQKDPLTQSQKSTLERILKNGKHLLALINDVLDLAKIEAGRTNVNYSQVDIRALISSVVEETQSIALEQKLTLKSSVEEGIDYIETDQTKLSQILLNLVSNGLKYTVEGEVTVTATRAKPSKNGTEQIAIAVQDSGIGISPEVKERIFEAFYQVDGTSTRKFGGTGLGLAIVLQLTNLLGGAIEVTSTPGKGSIFTVVLPVNGARTRVEQNDLRLQMQQSGLPQLLPSSGEIIKEAVEVLATVDGSEEIPPTQENVVLAVDDDTDVLMLVKSALENTQFKVVGVQDPLRVVEMVRQLHPCAITLDVMMPNLNGWQILYQLKSDPTTNEIPIIIVTVLSEPTTGYVLGADDYIMKPFNSNVLLDTLHRLIQPKQASQVK